jgi:hypothetical protein
MKRYLPVIAAVIVLLFSGLVHGLWTDRWSDRADLQAAAAKLKRLPMKLGDWEGEDLKPRTSGAGLTGTLSRRYHHRPTGRAVTVFLGCGTPGKVSIHTPDVCYTASGFKGAEPEAFTLPASSAAAGSVFMTANYRRERTDDRTHLRIFWSWSSGSGKWEVATDPRFAFATRPLLYKLYVLRETSGAPEPLEADPCVELMNQLLPALQREVLPAS